MRPGNNRIDLIEQRAENPDPTPLTPSQTQYLPKLPPATGYQQPSPPAGKNTFILKTIYRIYSYPRPTPTANVAHEEIPPGRDRLPGAPREFTFDYLSLISHISLFRHFSEEFIPPAVWWEVVEQGGDRPGATEIRMSTNQFDKALSPIIPNRIPDHIPF